MRWYTTKPEGWSTPVWRAARTFAQTAAVTLSAWLLAVAKTQVWDWRGLVYAVAIPSVSAALSAWSNR
jgi:hypothetical protein